MGVDYTIELGISEYYVFIATLALSILIGVYFGFFDKGQSTVSGYLLGGKNMSVLPITLSLVCSHISGVTLIGVPTEIYTYGTQYLISGFSYIVVGLVTAYVLLPIFYNLQLISLYEYLEMRFDSKVRKVVSFFFFIYMVFQNPLVVYGPALILNQVSGANVMYTSMVITAVCVFYTTIGGLKAVVWSDTLQGIIMFFAVIAVAVVGVIKVGGIGEIIEASRESGRLEFFIMDPDPRIRNTFWTSFIGVGVVITYLSGVHPSFIQRYVALPTMKKAKCAVLLYVTGCSIFFFLSGFLGMIMYAKYKDCDPKTSGLIDSPDQILPFFIVDTASVLSGIPGLFLAGIVSAALSTLSANFNTVSGTIFVDFVEPYTGKMTDLKSSNIMKLIVVVLGIFCFLVLLVIERLAAILELAYIVLGLSSGSILGIFLLGIFFPHATSLGVTVGALVSLVVMTWIMIGARLAVLAGEIVFPTKPMSVDGCAFNFTMLNSSLPMRSEEHAAFPLYEISVFYYSTLGCLITIIVGMVVSLAAGPQRIDRINPQLLSPFVHRFLPTYNPVPVKESELDTLPANGKNRESPY